MGTGNSHSNNACNGLRLVRLLTTAAALFVAVAAAPLSTAQAWTFHDVHDFCSERFCADGYQPFTRPTLAPSGKLYGTTTFVETDRDLPGSIYQLEFDAVKDHWQLRTLHVFCKHGSPCRGGAYPIGGVIVDVNGNLYGTTSDGGKNNGGVVFELSPDLDGRNWSYKKLHNFCRGKNCRDGAVPSSTLTYSGASSGLPYDGVSPLYGVTEEGGNNRSGTVYEIVPNGDAWKQTTLYKFCSQDNCADGYLPYGAVVLDQNGNIFGTTDTGGKYDKGVVFELSSNQGLWTETVLHDFCALAECADGAIPQELTIDAGGNLYGTTYQGGETHHGCCGTIFELSPDGSQYDYQVLYNFCGQRDCKDGATPTAPLLIDSSGTLFGTTHCGGGHDIDGGHCGGGTIFELSGSSLQVLYRFCSKAFCMDGSYPQGGVTLDANGSLIGVTQAGGKSASGGIFELSP